MATSSHTRAHVVPASTSNGKVVGTISQEFQNLLIDIETLVKSLTSLTGSELESAKAQLSQRIATAKNTAIDVRNNLAQKANDTIAITNNYVHEQPWKAVGIGVGAGLLVGLLLARRK